MLELELTQSQLGALEYVVVVVAILILLSSLDDLFIDLLYWKERLRLRRRPPQSAPTADELHNVPERTLAIMIPAWRESDVIASMIENMVAVLDYSQYKVFVGTYVNDPPTIEEVERMRRRYPHVYRVEVPHPGPTCKADCLNFVVEAMLSHEKECGTPFAGFVLHDSEDVLHPLELRYLNRALEGSDMVQLPVISLKRKWHHWVAGTYMDEFAESQKEMVVRECLTGSVPSAGVGTSMSHTALTALVAATRNRPFNTNSLTEDYDIGMRLSALGMRSSYGWLDLEPPRALCVRPLSVAELFPAQFSTSVRQKSRWILGIGLQSWKQIPLRGRSSAMKYMLLHDRKGVVTSFVAVFAYLLLAIMVAIRMSAGEGWPYPYFTGVTTQAWFGLLLVANLAFLLSRLGHRFYFTARTYGWQQGLLSWPRMVVGNFVNCFAVARAWRLFLGSSFFGQPIAWDKTMHHYPTAAELGRARQRLGELLVTWQAIAAEQLEEALARQQQLHQPLGKLLVEDGVIDEDLLADAIAFQADVPRGKVVASQARNCRSRVPARLAMRRRFVPLEIVEPGRILVGVSGPLSTEALQEIGAETGLEPIQRILRDSEVGASLEFLFRHELAVASPAAGRDRESSRKNG